MLPVDPDQPSAGPDSAADGEPSPAESELVRPVVTVPIPPPPGAPSPARRSWPMLAVAVLVVAILGSSALFMAGFQLGRQTATEPGTPATLSEEFKPFWDAWTFVTQHYAGEPVADKTLIDGAIRGMVSAIGDPYSTYLDAQQYRDSVQGLSGEFEGIGAEIGTVNAKR